MNINQFRTDGYKIPLNLACSVNICLHYIPIIPFLHFFCLVIETLQKLFLHYNQHKLSVEKYAEEHSVTRVISHYHFQGSNL